MSQWWACWCSLSCGPECILGLWLRIGVKHVAFYGLWPGMTSLELWLGLTSVADVSVLVLASTDGSRWIALLSDLLTSLVVLGRYRLCSYLGTPLGITVCDP